MNAIENNANVNATETTKQNVVLSTSLAEKLASANVAVTAAKTERALVRKIVTPKSKSAIVTKGVKVNADKIANAMSKVKVDFIRTRPVKEVSHSLAAYLDGDEIKLLGSSCTGSELLDTVIAKHYAATGKGLSVTDLKAVLKAGNSKRDNVSGHCATFAASEKDEMKASCPKSLKRFRKEGLYCVVKG